MKPHRGCVSSNGGRETSILKRFLNRVFKCCPTVLTEVLEKKLAELIEKNAVYIGSCSEAHSSRAGAGIGWKGQQPDS